MTFHIQPSESSTSGLEVSCKGLKAYKRGTVGSGAFLVSSTLDFNSRLKPRLFIKFLNFEFQSFLLFVKQFFQINVSFFFISDNSCRQQLISNTVFRREKGIKSDESQRFVSNVSLVIY